ncbi:Ig domain protein group 2 domain protein [Gemmatirosa kalamazoonensis]|uniref:Ig domain protein group 2 domain protein n=1 Tax=Gemmatirosa kalamazoonensis TaxID=861299 RepID=W0RGW5_9BACT|nr:Ig-like domain-containing protein [Gemmatirosa kalamazoonensis]AHG90021.1 Ig domain protein group 2 domain protein [Gemmatirosa kalamazoonensis]
MSPTLPRAPRGTWAAAASLLVLVGACDSPSTAPSDLVPQAPNRESGTGATVKWLGLSASTTRLVVGKSFRYVALALNPSGQQITPVPAFVWSSSRADVATIDSTGLARALKPGQVSIVVRQRNDTLGAQTGVVLNVVDAVAGNTVALKVSPTTAKVAVGGTTQLTPTPVDAQGKAITGRTFSYSALKTAIATVTSAGVVKGVANGTTTVKVSCDGLTVSVPVEVGTASTSSTTSSTSTSTTTTTTTSPTTTASTPTAPTGTSTSTPVVATVTVSPAKLTVQAGSSQLLVASTLAANGTAVAGTTVTWSSSAPNVATVASDGRVTGVAAGTANVVATAGTVKATVPVTVTAAALPMGTQVTLAVQRFDGGSGPVMVSNGIPLTRGMVTVANLAQVHVVVNGVEQRVYVRPLYGRHSDGSLRALFVQFDYNIPNAAPIAATLVVGGGSRTQPDLAARPAKQVPAAAALPTDATYLVSTRWTGVTYAAKSLTPMSLAPQYESDYARLEAADWSACGPKFDCGRTAGYDRAYILYQAWQRSGNPTYWYHATAAAADYLNGYVIPNGGPTAWWSQTEGVAVHYWATGDEMSRYQLRKMAEMLAWMVRPGFSAYIGGTYGDDRFRAKAMMAALDAAMLEISTQPADAANYYKSMGAANTYYASYLTPSTLGTWVTAVLGTQRKNGQFGGRYYSAGTWSADSGGQSNYMVGMLLSALIRYYDEVSPDSRIPAAVKKCIDDMWAREWEPSQLAFEYHSLRGTDEGATTPARPNPEPGLNGFMAYPFAWYARVAGGATYDARVDQILTGLAQSVSRNWWAASGKAFDEAFAHLFNTFAFRAGLH